jgi:tetratricopeptide (TPR) repeat protein
MPKSVDQLIAMGYEARRKGSPDEARQLFSMAAEKSLSAATANPLLAAKALAGMGQIENDLNNYAPAHENYRQALALYRQMNQPLRVAHTIRHIADILRRERKFAEGGFKFQVQHLTAYSCRPFHSTPHN